MTLLQAEVLIIKQTNNFDVIVRHKFVLLFLCYYNSCFYAKLFVSISTYCVCTNKYNLRIYIWKEIVI